MQVRPLSTSLLLGVLLLAVAVAAMFAGLSVQSIRARNDFEQTLTSAQQAMPRRTAVERGPSAEADDGAKVPSLAPIGAVAATRPVLPVVVRQPQLLVRMTHDVVIRSGQGRGRVIGVMPARSMYIKDPMTVWVRKVSPDRQWGYVQVPWSARAQQGWMPLAGLQQVTTRTVVMASLRDRRIRVWQRGRKVVDVPAAIGGPASPTPRGEFFITDQVEITPASTSFGSHAFGISAIQPRTPAGWTGGNQMAIHGTGDPSSIGKAVSAGCLRVSERALTRLRPLLQRGTPVIIQS